jgi:hypothetical protein
MDIYIEEYLEFVRHLLEQVDADIQYQELSEENDSDSR